ncbi:MAG: hypothetical protein FWC87_15745 [Acidimicrobiaceae bacterium]|nr:hypothetical protein [Acidimicrobiaceae bacterium]
MTTTLTAGMHGVYLPLGEVVVVDEVLDDGQVAIRWPDDDRVVIVREADVV